MDPKTLFSDDQPEKRLSYYRLQGIEHPLLIVPFESLSRLAKQASLEMAGEWGRDVAAVPDARLDVEHADDARRPLAGLWLMGILNKPVHPADAFYWTEEAKRWAAGEEADPRLDAYRSAYHAASEALPAVGPPGRKCRCAACKKRFGARQKT